MVEGIDHVIHRLQFAIMSSLVDCDSILIFDGFFARLHLPEETFVTAGVLLLSPRLHPRLQFLKLKMVFFQDQVMDTLYDLDDLG